MQGRWIEDTSCFQCGWTPPTPEDDGWEAYLQALAEVVNSHGKKIGHRSPRGTVA